MDIKLAVGIAAMGIALVALILGISSQPDGFTLANSEAQTVVGPSKYDLRIAELDREAIETAYKRHVELLFDIWVKDTGGGEPARVTRGAAAARRAYINAMTSLERRAGQ